MKKVIFYATILLLLYSCSSGLKKEPIATMEYLDYWQGYKITSTEGSVVYRQPGWVQSMHISPGDLMFFQKEDGKTKSTDTIFAKVVYYQYKEYPTSNEVPASYYSGEYQGIAIPDTTNLNKTILFVSKTEPIIGSRAKFYYLTMLGGDRTKWELMK